MKKKATKEDVKNYMDMIEKAFNSNVKVTPFKEKNLKNGFKGKN